MRYIHLTTEQVNKLRALGNEEDPNFNTTVIDNALHGITELIRACGDDPDRDGLEETPFRVVKAFLEYTQGYREDPDKHLEKQFDVDHDELVLVKDIPFSSMCEHHFAPFTGKIHIAYIPSGKITGLSKFARMADGYAKRFQVQERLTTQIANAIEYTLMPLGVGVIIEAEHSCMCNRGIQKRGTSTVTSAMRGAFRDVPEARAELLKLIFG